MITFVAIKYRFCKQAFIDEVGFVPNKAVHNYCDFFAAVPLLYFAQGTTTHLIVNLFLNHAVVYCTVGWEKPSRSSIS